MPIINSHNVIQDLQTRKEAVWLNPNLKSTAEAMDNIKLTRADVDDAENRLKRFAPFIQKCFPETKALGGLIESPLSEISKMRDWLNENEGSQITGRLFLKRDSDLAIAGSIKARGGIYEVLKHSEKLAMEAGLLREQDDYSILADEKFRRFFSQYAIHVGSTGNLGLSIGIISAALGYHANVHVSADAKQWKKDLLREKGVNVVEYSADYSKAVEEGRKMTEGDPMSYFVDDENSEALFLGYAVAARRLKTQLLQQTIPVDHEHPMIVYIPCGVGGAPGGVCYGLKQEFGDDVHVFFVEPIESPCMLLGLATGKQEKICVQDIGLSGKTEADGLAVGRASRFVGKTIRELISGVFTVSDAHLYNYMRALFATENLFIEPSSCAAFVAPSQFTALSEYIEAHDLEKILPHAAHIVWATGGSLVPLEERKKYFNTFI